MKMPKYILTIGFNEYVVADNKGLATIMAVLEDAVPVRAHLTAKSKSALNGLKKVRKRCLLNRPLFHWFAFRLA